MTTRQRVTASGVFLAACSLILVVATLIVSEASLNLASAMFLAGLGAVIIVSTSGGKWGLLELLLLSLTVRLFLLFLITLVPPAGAVSGITGHAASGVVLEDEATFVSLGLSSVSIGDGQVAFSNHHQRVAAWYGLIFSVLGRDLVWGRFVNVCLTAATSVILYAAVRRFVSPQARRLAWLLAAMSPVSVLWSVVYLREALLVFGVVLVLYGTAYNSLEKVSFRGFFVTAVGLGICGFARPVVSVVLLPIVALAATGRMFKRATKVFMCIGLIGWCLIIGLLLAFPGALFEEFGAGSLLQQSGEAWDDLVVQNSFRFGMVGELGGVLRNASFLALLMISPVITGVLQLVPVVGHPSWPIFAVSAYAVSWWFVVPLVIAACYSAIKVRTLWWLTVAGTWVVWFSVSSISRFGIGSDAFRYREALWPLCYALAVFGYDFVRSSAKQSPAWRLYLPAYGLSVGLILIFRLAAIAL